MSEPDDPNDNGDDAALAFEALHRRYESKIHDVLLRMVGDEDAAEDLTLETFVRAWRNWDKRAPAQLPSTWLHQIALEAAKEHFRRKHEERLAHGGDLLDEAPPRPSAAETRGYNEALGRAINALPAEYREALLLCEGGDLSYEEIARRLGLTIAATKTRLRRARQKIKQRMEPYEQGGMQNDSNTANWQVWQDPEVVRRFSDRRLGGLLGGDVQSETLVRLVSAAPAVAGKRGGLAVLDLGCGDGVLLETLLAAFPNPETAIALDGSAAMLDRARERLAGRENVSFVLADFNEATWTDELPTARAFDVIVSGFAIHHSEDERKRELYAEIFNLLAPGGVFVNVEHVASATPRGEQFFEMAYAENLLRFQRDEQGEASLTLDDVLHELRTRPDKVANRLAPVETQLGWLREAGFDDVDCYWKHFELAVLAGYKPAGEQP